MLKYKFSTGDPVALRKYTSGVGVSSTTAWRWIKRGWLHPINIAGRLYLTQDDIEQFQARASAGEFSKKASGAAGKYSRANEEATTTPASPGTVTEKPLSL